MLVKQIERTELEELKAFLRCPTPESWVEKALADIPTLLIDHAHCERKAASTALSLLHRHIQYPDLCYRLSRLAREELRHFEQVHRIMMTRDIAYKPLSASRYAKTLHDLVRPSEPGLLLDQLLIAAIIEARSCERFAAIAPHLDEELSKFYMGLLASEARHYTMYVDLAKRIAREQDHSGRTWQFMERRLQEFLQVEAETIQAPEEIMRFHSGA